MPTPTSLTGPRDWPVAALGHTSGLQPHSGQPGERSPTVRGERQRASAAGADFDRRAHPTNTAPRGCARRLSSARQAGVVG